MKSNEELRADIMAELNWNPQLKDVSTQIGVSVNNGIVTVSGLVDSYAKKVAAEKAVQSVHGVHVVASEIEVRLPQLGIRTDTEIAEAVNNALRWNSAIQEDKIEVKVENAWVFLDGEADFEYQRISAQRNVEELVGVKGVTNSIKVVSKPIDTVQIKNKISQAFQRSALIDSGAIKIDANGSRVTLTGTVRSWIEKDEAEKIAWSSPGVLTVDNRIGIDAEVFA